MHEEASGVDGRERSGEPPADRRAEAAARVATWAGLLGRWMEFARATVALPVDETGDRWRRSAAGIIELHAIAMALRELSVLAEEERPLAWDRAALGVRRASAELAEIWRGQEMPAGIRDLERDAAEALAATEPMARG